MERRHYLLKTEKDGQVVYDGDKWEEVLANIKPSVGPGGRIDYCLLSILVVNGQAQIITERTFSYRSGQRGREQLGFIQVPLGDLEKILEGIKATA